MLFLHRLTEVFADYFKELEEESIRDNFVIVYELMDEMMDFGYPQTTETKILQEYVVNRMTAMSDAYLICWTPSLDILRKMPTNWRPKFDLPWQSLTLYHGVLRVSNTRRMRFSWMLSKVSIFW
jgi:hypothetical protein